MKSDTSKIVIILVVMVGLLCSLSFFQSRMNGIRATHHLTDSTPLENAPPMVAFSSVALGGFRGLLADYLWLRSSRMQDEGNYYEMVQLADWIVKLQPRFTGAHAFLGWNMAYNVSVTFTSFEDRWRWVKRGIELIRDEAMEYNPGDPELFRQLGWIYQHKMGQDMDDANRYYKTEFAKEMIRVYGDFYGQWTEIDRAPLNETKLLAVLGDKAGDYKQLLAAQQLDFAHLELRFREMAALPPEVKEDFEELGIDKPVELCLRHRWLLNKYRLDPKIMMHCNRLFGDLDWRLPEAHAIYWAQRGREKWFAPSASFKRLSCERMIFQALNAAASTGRLLYLKGDLRNLQMTPNFAVANAADQAYQDAQKLFPDTPLEGPYRNFQDDSIVRFYLFGYKKTADAWYKRGQKYAPDHFPKDMTLDDYVVRALTDEMESPSQRKAQAAVQSYLQQAYTFLALADDEESEAFKTFESMTLVAKQLYDHYAKLIGDTTLRRGLPPFDELRKVALGTVASYLRSNEENKHLADNLEHFQNIPLERFIPRAEEIAPPKVK